MEDASTNNTDPAMTPQQAALLKNESAFQTYRRLAVGNESLPFFAAFELSQFLLSNMPALPGFALRALCYPWLFKACGKMPGFGRGVVIRNPKAIGLGKKVIFDDYSALDAHGADSAITIGDFVTVGRHTSLVAKSSRIEIGRAANIGSYCRIATESRVEIGESTLIAAYCYIGPGNHQQLDDGTPLISAPMENRGGVKIGSHVWVGAGALIMDGVTIGDNAIIGAQSFVRENVPAGAVVAGTPARVVKNNAQDTKER